MPDMNNIFRKALREYYQTPGNQSPYARREFGLSSKSN
tara:strand:+ start:654 stop:767 length:114 start_codon:yes stop_codon:yes gene_type:complete